MSATFLKLFISSFNNIKYKLSWTKISNDVMSKSNRNVNLMSSGQKIQSKNSEIYLRDL